MFIPWTYILELEYENGTYDIGYTNNLTGFA